MGWTMPSQRIFGGNKRKGYEENKRIRCRQKTKKIKEIDYGGKNNAEGGGIAFACRLRL